jgi:invasion protein IalB
MGRESGEQEDPVMNVRIASGPARPGACTLALALGTAAALTLALGTIAFAQAPPPAPPVPKAPAPKAAAPKAPPQQKPAEPPQQQAGGPAQPQLIWSNWVKLCPPKGTEENAQEVCVTSRDGRDESGFPVITAQMIENQTQQQKLLHIFLPLGMLLRAWPNGQGPVRVVIDDGQPMNAPYSVCFANGCMAEFESSAEFVGRMKKGQSLVVQGLHAQIGPLQLKVPLDNFGKVNDAPATDLKVFEEQQKKMNEELQKKGEELRKKLESQQQAAPTR